MEVSYTYQVETTETPEHVNLNTTTANTRDEQELLSKLNFQQFQFQLPAIMYTSILMCIGTPGNIVVLYVYFFKWRKSTSRMFILFLTSLDLINCLTTLPLEIYIMRYSIMLDMPGLCKISRFITYTMNSSSAAVLVAIAVDRFRRICRPHGPQFSARKSKFICFGCIMLAFTLTWPSLLFYGTRTIYIGKVQGKLCLLENKFDTSVYPYVFFVILMASTVVIFTTLSVLYYFVGIQIYNHRKKRMRRKAEIAAARSMVEQEHTSHSKDETLLQDSDSNEIKKNHIRSKSNAEKCIEGMELKPIQSNHLQVNTQINEISVADSACTSDSRIDIASSNGGNSQKRLRKNKNGFTKRKGTLKDSLTKANGHCMHMKLRIGRSTLMLFLITLAYIVSFLPFYVIAIIRQTYSDFVSQLEGVSYMAYHVFLRSYLLSSAINPIIYSFCNAQFRTFCLDMFRKKSERRTVL